MAINFSFVQSSFLGGEWSQTAQGRIELPEYRTAMNVCLNGLPLEKGAWTRRPGFVIGDATANGTASRTIEYAFQENAPCTLEFTDGLLRFYQSGQLTFTEGLTGLAISSISSATPAVVTLSSAATIANGTPVKFSSLSAIDPLLLNRQFTVQQVAMHTTTEFKLYDAMTGAAIAGSALQTFGTGNLNAIQQVVTPYIGGSWASVQMVQGDGQTQFGTLLHANYPPQVLAVTVEPSSTQAAQFSLTPAQFIDGPYLPYVANGAQVTPNGTSGSINLVISFAAYSSSTAYTIGAYVVSSSVCYQSLIDENLGNTPASSPSAWAVVPPDQAVGPNGFVATDVGRHVRLSSEPALWASGTTYTAGQTVTYGAQTYWTSLTASNTGNVPGVDLVHWTPNLTAATWTWGKISSLLNFIPGAPASITYIGNMTSGGGLSGAFDGVQDQSSAGGAALSGSNTSPPNNVSLTGYAGQNFSGCSPASYQIGGATIYPTTDAGFAELVLITGDLGVGATLSLVAYLYASNSSPSSATNGTLLGQTTIINNVNPTQSPPQTVVFSGNPINITSSDQSTDYAYVWVTYVLSFNAPNAQPRCTVRLQIFAAQIQIYEPKGTGSTGNGVVVYILGPPLLNTNAIRTWQLGIYNGTVGWPTCGTYHEGRLCLGGSINNRFDASEPNQDWTGQISFAPTEYDGTVTDGNAINYTLNASDVNTILWFKPDLQGIIIGTEKGEWLVQATTINSPLSQLNIQAHRVTRQGSSVSPTALPVQTEHTTAYIQRYGRKIIEYFTDIFSGKFTAPNLMENAMHLSTRESPFVELAYQQNLTPTIWARTSTGQLRGCAYKRDTLMTSQGPTSKGWHKHTLGSGRSIVSMSIGPTPDGTSDTLAITTAPPVGDVYHTCFMTPIFEETAVSTSAMFLDEAITNVAYAVVTINGVVNLQISGLWYLNGYNCDVFAGGYDLGTYAVANGQMNVPLTAALQASSGFSAAVVATFNGTMPIAVGFTYTSQGQVVPPDSPEQSGAQLGPALGKLRRVHEFAARLVNTQGISWGTDFGRLHAWTFTNIGGTVALPPNQLYTGKIWGEIDGENSRMEALCWQITRPWPATIAALAGKLKTEDRR